MGGDAEPDAEDGGGDSEAPEVDGRDMSLCGWALLDLCLSLASVADCISGCIFLAARTEFSKGRQMQGLLAQLVARMLRMVIA